MNMAKARMRRLTNSRKRRFLLEPEREATSPSSANFCLFFIADIIS